MAETAVPKPPFQIFIPKEKHAALGLAVNFLMTKPAFANRKFGEWSRILVGQINRGHFCFIVDAAKNIHGFAGWALTSKEKAEAWVTGRAPLSYQDGLSGNCVVFNAWAADSNEVHRYMLVQARRLFEKQDAMYFKRYYPDGRVRPARVTAERMRARAQRQSGSLH